MFYAQSIMFVISSSGIIRGDNLPVTKSSIAGEIVAKRRTNCFVYNDNID